MRTWIHCVVNLSEKKHYFLLQPTVITNIFLIQIILVQSLY